MQRIKTETKIARSLSHLFFGSCILLMFTFITKANAISIAGQADKMEIPINKSKVVQLNRPIQKVSLGNPSIADIVVLKNQQIYILGKGVGTTNVLLWDKNAKLIKALDIEITHNLNELKKKLYELLPNEKIEVFSSQGSIVLKGQVDNLTNMDQAVRIARSFAYAAMKPRGENEGTDMEGVEPVVNLLTVGGSSQVMLKVTVAELERTTIRKLGIKWYAADQGSSGRWNWGGTSGGASFPDLLNADGLRTPIFGGSPIAGPVIDEFLPNDLSIADRGLFASFLSDDFAFAMALEAAKENGTAKILAEPTLIALSGEEAKFLSGGEYPIPVPDDDGSVTIEFKEFGVAVSYVPVVLSNGSINLELSVSVTNLATSNSIAIRPSEGTPSTFFIPALTNRSASTTVELADGQSIGIAGLIDEEMRANVSKFPGLGDLPIIGHLFRSEEFERGETELVIMVTPHLTQPMDKPLSSLPTDQFVEPSDMEFYLLGRIHGNPNKAADNTGHNAANSSQPESKTSSDLPGQTGGVDGQFGHSIDE
jgi:pilus assembly protein CpaC